MALDYEYDVFISYKRSQLVESWVRKFFLPLFESWLTEELGGVRPRIFYDQLTIKAGERWLQKIVRGLTTSKVLLPVCSATYFRSQWCMLEWESFALREQHLTCDRLRIPIKHCDGDSFPEEAQKLQMIDFSECTSGIPAFLERRNEVFMETFGFVLEANVKKLAVEVAEAIRIAPVYQPSWPSVPDPPGRDVRISFNRIFGSSIIAWITMSYDDKRDDFGTDISDLVSAGKNFRFTLLTYLKSCALLN